MNLLCPLRFIYLVSLILGKGWTIQQDKIQNTNAMLSIKLSLVVHLVWLIMGALTSKGPASLCQLVAMSSTVWPINIRGYWFHFLWRGWAGFIFFVANLWTREGSRK